jgi:hypothetical protein
VVPNVRSWRVLFCAIAVVSASISIGGRTADAVAGRTGSGCAGSGGGGTAGIGATLSCGLPPPSAPTPQNDGNGILGTSSGPPLGSKCIATTKLPNGTVDPTTGSPSHEYVTLAPSVSGNPETGLIATATIDSPLPIGSPTGPMHVAVPAEPVKTAAQQNADAAAEAQGIAAQLNAYQQQQIAAATSTAFDNPSFAIEALLRVPQFTAANFYVPAGPPVEGAPATSEDATTWTFLETVYVEVGRVVRDQVGIGAGGLPTFGPEYCSGLLVAGSAPLHLSVQVGTTVPTFTGQVNQLADALWHSFRRGSIVTLPAGGSATYVGAPTCAGIDTGLPTGSATPNPFTLTLPLSLSGVAGSLPVVVSGRVAVSIVADGVHWDFHDPTGDTSVHGQGSADPVTPRGAPTYDVTTGTWPDAAAECMVYHQYRGLAASPGVATTATEHFHISVSGVYSTGSAVPVSFAYQYEPVDSPVTWSATPRPIYQIEAVPYAPAP